jgi:hypothetical protein
LSIFCCRKPKGKPSLRLRKSSPRRSRRGKRNSQKLVSKILSRCSVFSHADAQPMVMKHADAQPIRVHATDVQDILRGMAFFLPFLKFSK